MKLRRTLLAVLALLSVGSDLRAGDLYFWVEEIEGDLVLFNEGSLDLEDAVVEPYISRFAPYGTVIMEQGQIGFFDTEGLFLLGFPTFSRAGSFYFLEAAADGTMTGFDVDRLRLPGDYESGAPIYGSFTWPGLTLEQSSLDTTPFSITSEDGLNTVHFFQQPGIDDPGEPVEPIFLENTSVSGIDLLIGKSSGRLIGDNIIDPRRAGSEQTIRYRRSIFRTNTSRAHLVMQNDTTRSARLTLRSSGDRLPRMRVSARVAGSKANIAAALQVGKFSRTLAAGNSLRVIYQVTTDRYFAGVFRGKDRHDHFRFRLTGGGAADHASMVNRYRRP